MDMKANLSNIVKEAQKMQERMQKAQEELIQMTVTGEAGAGLVKINMNGRYDVKSVFINQNLMDEDKEMIEDLVAAAVNDAVRKVEKASKDKITDLTSDLKLPTDLELPDLEAEDEDKE